MSNALCNVLESREFQEFAMANYKYLVKDWLASLEGYNFYREANVDFLFADMVNGRTETVPEIEAALYYSFLKARPDLYREGLNDYSRSYFKVLGLECCLDSYSLRLLPRGLWSRKFKTIVLLLVCLVHQTLPVLVFRFLNFFKNQPEVFFRQIKNSGLDLVRLDRFPKMYDGLLSRTYGERFGDFPVCVDVGTDGFHTKPSLWEILKIAKYVNRNVLVIDTLVTWRSLAVNVGCLIRFVWFVLWFNPKHRGDLFFVTALLRSLPRLYGLVCKKPVLKHFLSLYSREQVGGAKIMFTLFEYPYGKLLSHLCNVAGVEAIGFQHGPCSPCKLLCRQPAFLRAVQVERGLFCEPSEIFVEDYNSLIVYGFDWRSKISIMDHVNRLVYSVSDDARSSGTVSVINDSERKRLLILGLHGAEFDLLWLEKLGELGDRVRYVRLHPRSNLAPAVKRKLSQRFIVDMTKIGDLKFKYDCFVGSYSSLLKELHDEGLPVEIIIPLGRLDQSPLGYSDCTDHFKLQIGALL